MQGARLTSSVAALASYPLPISVIHTSGMPFSPASCIIAPAWSFNLSAFCSTVSELLPYQCILIAWNVYFGLCVAASERNWDVHSIPPGLATPSIVPIETAALLTPGVATKAPLEDWYCATLS